jgi:hypothetical protein
MSGTGILKLADAISFSATTTFNTINGTFDAVSYNVTTGGFSATGGIVRMGSGTWTMIGTNGFVNSAGSITLYKGTANIILSDTSTTARTFAGGGASYNKLTIGGTTGTSTLTITGNNFFTEIASTKTVAHTISLGVTTQTVGAWTVTGTVGNVVTLTGAGTISVAGSRVSGVNYLALGPTVLSATSPGEFYAGANSTGGTNFILTAAPAATTRYWVGGTGTWDSSTTTNWSASSGGLGGASVPTSADAVVFNNLSNSTAYTVTCTATQLRCAALTISGPLTGNITWAGTAPLAIHGSTSLPAAGLTNSYTGTVTLTGSATGKTFTTNGVTLASALIVNGINSGWALGSALNIGSSSITVTNGSFDTGNYTLSMGSLLSSGSTGRTITLGSSTINATLLTFTFIQNLTFSAGTSTVNIISGGANQLGGLTWNNVVFTSGVTTVSSIAGANTFANLTIAGQTAGAACVFFGIAADQIITGTLTLSAGTDATMRNFLQSTSIGVTRTLTVGAFAAGSADVDFRDITITGAAAPISGTRFGDCKGNSGIAFGAGSTKYWNLAAGGSWSDTGWATSSGGTPSINNFPLSQDTVIFDVAGLTSGNTVTLSVNYNIGDIDMSARTSNTMTLAMGSTAHSIYGNWINGTGTTLSGGGALTFAGRGSQTITSAGQAFTQGFIINNPGGSVTLIDSLSTSFATAGALTITLGTFDANGQNLTLSGAASTVAASSANIRTIAIGSGVWTLAGSGTAWNTLTITNLTISGTGSVTLTSASAKTFSGGNGTFTNITLDNGGAGQLTISGNNTFKDITNSYKYTGAATISLAATSQTVSQFTAAGTSGNLLTITGTSAAAPATLIYTGSGKVNSDYLTPANVRVYNLASTWYAGTHSTNGGSLGWIFTASPTAAATGNFFFMF